MKKIRLLFFDIETSNLNADLSPILVFGYKWSDEAKPHVLSIWDKDLVEGGLFSRSDRKLCKKLVEIFAQADLLVAHYGQRFDRCFINSRLLYHGLPPIDKELALSDTWRLMKDNVKLTSNRLKAGAQFFNTRHQKLDNGGWQTYMDSILGNEKCRKNLIKYCAGDVLATEELYNRLRPFDTKVNHALGSTSTKMCPACGSEKTKSHGTRRTRTKEYQRRICLSCGKFFRLDARGKNPR